MVEIAVDAEHRREGSELEPAGIQLGRWIFDRARVLVEAAAVGAPFHLAVVDGREHGGLLVVQAVRPPDVLIDGKLRAHIA